MKVTALNPRQIIT